MASTGEAWRLGRRPGLDGLRGVAVLLVIVGHAKVEQTGAAGRVGVGLFFALSGFLITALLLEEREKTGGVLLRAFFKRRAIRLLPALVAFLAVTAIVGPVLLGPNNPDPASIVGVLLYGANWLAIFGHGVGEGVGHTWSLAVEGQFYLAWPLLALVSRRCTWRIQFAACLLGAAASLAWRFELWEAGRVVHSYAGTDANAAGLLVGAAAALIARETEWTPPAWAVTASAVILVALATAQSLYGAWLLAPALSPFAGAVLVLAAARQEVAVSGQRLAVLRYVGRRSYALYLWQVPLLMAVAPLLDGPRWLIVGAMVALGFGLAELSWRWVEQPTTTWLRRHVASTPPRQVATPVTQ